MRATWTAAALIVVGTAVGPTAALIVLGTAASPAAAQEAEFQSVANPFQDGYLYAVGDDLAPNVSIDGVRWTLVRVAAKGERDIVADKEIPVIVDLEFENRRDRSVGLLVVLLLENENGDPLERIRCNPIRAGSGRFKASRQKAKVMGNALLATKRLYLFCEYHE
jgi:hypothetical protein